jgi:transcriptional regulator with XRE-family HTH domain
MQAQEVSSMNGYPNIKAMIDGKGLKMKFVARSLGWHPSKLSQIIGGHRPAKLSELTALAQFLGHPPEFFLNQPLAMCKRTVRAQGKINRSSPGFSPKNINPLQTNIQGSA